MKGVKKNVKVRLLLRPVRNSPFSLSSFEEGEKRLCSSLASPRHLLPKKKEGELAVCRRVKEEKVVLYFKLEYLNCDVMEMSPDNRTNLHRITGCRTKSEGLSSTRKGVTV